MEQSILISTKKILGLEADYTAFDPVIVTHINTAFSTLSQMGVGPSVGFEIEDESAEWSSFTHDDPKLNNIKTYVYLKVRLLFDPPTTSYSIEAAQKQLEELEWRISVNREDTQWIDPTPPSEEVIL